MKNKTIVIGVSGFARSGKDTFVKIARKIFEQNGYTTQRLAFADALKDDIDGWLKDKYGISAWTENLKEKNIIRPFLVAHGCGKRQQTKGKYWINKLDEQIRNGITCCKEVDKKHVFLISDVRFPNEVKWIHDSWNGWLVHVKKYSIKDNLVSSIGGLYHPDKLIKNDKVYDSAPNDEEAKNDPLCYKEADYKLELENVIDKTLKETGIKITADSLVDNTYLNKKIKRVLQWCPLLTIK